MPTSTLIGRAAAAVASAAAAIAVSAGLRRRARSRIADLERALAEYRDLHRILAEHGGEVIYVEDRAGRPTYVSPAVERVLGYTPDQVASRSAGALHDLVHPDDRERMRARHAELPLDATYTGCHRCRHADGRWIWLDVTVSPVRGADGATVGVCVIARDVTATRDADERRRASEERFQQFVEHAACGIYRATGDGRFLDVNPALVRMLGYDSADELLAVRLEETIYVDRADRGRLLARLRADTPHGWLDVRWRRRDGTPIVVRLAARAVHDATGAVQFCEAIVEDVTERHRRETLLRRNERLASLGQMLAGVAHELNNPLAAVSGFAQLLRRGRLAEEEAQAVDIIDREAQRAAAIVRDLLAFARRRDGTPHALVDLRDVARHVLSARHYALDTGGIRAELHVPPKALLVLGDRSQLEQAVLNLVLNAEQAIEGGAATGRSPAVGAPRGHVILRARRADDQLVLEVEDDGPGIPPEDLTRIWDPFWTTKADGEGTGLGLAVTHGIVAGHGGTVDVESDPAWGTRFRLVLPAPSAEEEQRHEELSLPDHAHRPLDVLVVDRDVETAAFLQRYLSGRGHAAVLARDAAHAVALLARGAFDVVLCDVELADADGGCLAAALRARADTRVVRTGYPHDMTAGTDVMLSKPFELDVLRRAIERE
ncbi:MAG TPA: PAS domain S-box protein [Gemmatimonadaceae bacterium]|nr:PAS domain S-box protein [Gemmatimonadaceae bacterium]